jgi:hypothetical protein
MDEDNERDYVVYGDEQQPVGVLACLPQVLTWLVLCLGHISCVHVDAGCSATGG